VSPEAQPRLSRAVLALWTLLVVAFVVLLSPALPQDVRQATSAVGLTLGGLLAMAAAMRRASLSSPRDARPWRWVVAGSGLMLVANTWSSVTDADPLSDSAVYVNICISVALLFSTMGIISFPGVKRRGADLLVMALDGVVAGGALLLITSAVVYPELLSSDSVFSGGTLNRTLNLAIPALDVILVTVAVMLALRARRADRWRFGLVAAAYPLYAISDLAFAVEAARGTFEFGTWIDLGWILGWLTVFLAALVPPRVHQPEDEADRDVERLTDVVGTSLVFGALAVATAVQVLPGSSGRFETAQSALWVLVVVAAGLRQIVLTLDNHALRRGLKRRVDEQTADLRRLARQNEVLVTSVGDGVYGVDHEGRVTFANPSAAHLLGWRTDELIGRRAHETFHAPDAEGAPYPWVGCYVHEAIVHGVLASAEEDEYLRADGTRFPVEITASPLVDDGDVRGAVVTFRDVTQRREVDRMKNEFLSVVSHELRTPLTSIRGSLGLLGGGRMGELPDRALTLVNVALQSSERLTRLINDLLDIERMESGTRPMELHPTEVRSLLESTADQIEGMAGQAGVRIVVGRAEGRAMVDEDRMIQTLLNLLGNAIKFSERGGEVRLGAVPEGSHVHLTVSDDGRGIPADKLESVFERFQQVDSSDTRQKGGTGLGLTISRGIVEKHGGRIWAESELGVGTTVHVTVPAAARTSQSAEAPTPPAPAPGAATVLVCDDDATVVEQFCALLRLHGFRAVGVTEGARALDLVRSERPQAVVLDLMMPGTTGAEVLQALRADETTHDVPVVVISGMGPETDRDTAEATQEWLVKPVSETRLVNAVALAVAGAPVPAVGVSGTAASRGLPLTSGTVLLVEDDEELTEVLAATFADAGLEVQHAASVSDAVALGPEVRPDVLVLDMRLPDGTGEDVVAAFTRRWALARTPLVVYSAVDLDRTRRDGLTLGPTVFLTKGETTPESLRDQVLSLVRAVTSDHLRTTT
jgi:PAS domain S-box-containing protein